MTRPIATRDNHDHFGFYEIGPYKTYSKIEAIEISARTGIELHRNFNDAVFNAFDWKTEPAGDLNFWYAERARQIRDKYDYLVMMYSGGPDSTNMLKAFVDNNIYIDEIAHYVIKDGTPFDMSEPWNAEIVHNSFPNAKRLIESNPIYKTTIQRVIDGGPYAINKIITANPEEYFYNEGAYYFGAWGTTFSDLRYLVPEYQQLIENKSVCFIWGHDKPNVSVSKSNKFQIHFYEFAAATFVKPKHQFENRQDKFDEAFYWTPDLPEVCCKQAHVLKNYIENFQLSQVDGILIKKVDKPPHGFNICFEKDNQLLALNSDGIHTLIYPGFCPENIIAPKPPAPIFSEKDKWWFKNLNDKTTSWYINGMLDIRQRIKKIHPKWWFEYRIDPTDPNSLRAGIHMCKNSYDLN